MQASEEDTKEESILDLTDKAYQDLNIAKSQMEEKEKRIQELAEQSSKRFNEELKMSNELKQKIIFLQDLASSLSKKNQDLELKNKELENQKIQNNKLTSDLRKNLERVVLKEKELELKTDNLSRQVKEKSSDLLKAEKLAVIGELASRMAHDLRNPLSTIKNVVEIIEAKPRMKIEEKLQFYGKLRRAIDRISHQVDDILDFVRATELRLEKNSLTSMLNTAIDGIVIPGDVKLTVEQNDVEVLCDNRKIIAVFTNLLLNAIQATNNSGKVNVRILDNDDEVLIAFEDSGPGIPDDVTSKIFDPLFTTKQTGTGLGLSICKTIVEQHRGNITVKNNPTTFLVTIPKNTE